MPTQTFDQPNALARMADHFTLRTQSKGRGAWIDHGPYTIAILHTPSGQKPCQWVLKRLVDISGSAVGLVLLMPLLVLVALIIQCESPGAFLYKQKRIGLHGKQFNMYKFRSMCHDAEGKLEQLLAHNQSNEGMFKMSDDPRVTRVGRFIRKFSIDELPQLLNVVKGEMSLVGPRPPVLRELNNYKDWHYVRFATLPGLTGLWQVSGRSNIQDFDSVVKLDFHYIKSWNLWLDLKLLLQTLPVVLLGRDTA